MFGGGGGLGGGQPFHEVTPREFYDRFVKVETMSEVDPPPIVRKVRDLARDHAEYVEQNEKEHRSIRLQVYFFLAAVAGAIGAGISIRFGVLGGP